MRSRAAQYLAALAFGLASSVHAGVLFTGLEHSKAGTAEGVIAAVLALGIISSVIWPGPGRAPSRSRSRASPRWARWSAPS
jgi:hypothetical protein